MTENEMNQLKDMMRAMEWQVNISGKDARKIYRSALAANITGFAIVVIGSAFAKEFLKKVKEK